METYVGLQSKLQKNYCIIVTRNVEIYRLINGYVVQTQKYKTIVVFLHIGTKKP